MKTGILRSPARAEAVSTSRKASLKDRHKRHGRVWRLTGRISNATDGTAPGVSGTVAPGFEPVMHAFADNFRHHGEVGAAVAVYWRGEKVVDLWGGVRTARGCTPWQATTLSPLGSAGGALTALCCAVAHSRGWLRYDRTVAEYWPEFAQAGKHKITVRGLLCHQAGLSAVDVRAEQLTDREALAGILARQAARWKAGSCHGYHGAALDLYAGELLRRCDPKQRSLEQFFRQEVAGPLDLDVHAALPAPADRNRLAAVAPASPLEFLDRLETRGPRFLLASLWPCSLVRRSLRTDRALRQSGAGAGLPSVDGLATARELARLYGVLSAGGVELGLDPITLTELERPPVLPWQGSGDAVLKRNTAYAMGFWKPCAGNDFGSDARAYGAPVIGGGLSFADPSTAAGFAYLPNRLGPHVTEDPRANALANAVYACLAER